MDNSINSTAEGNNNIKTTFSNKKKWERVSPIGLIYFVVKFIKRLCSYLLYLTPAIILSYSHIIANAQVWVPVILSTLSLMLLSAILNYYYFQFRLSTNTVEIRTGVIARKNINLPFERIQNVRVEQPMYFRPFNLTSLTFDTAGSSKEEARVVALDIKLAHELQRQILATHSNVQKTSDEISGFDEQVLIKRTFPDLLVHGICNNKVWILFGGLGPFFDDIVQLVNSWLSSIGVDGQQIFNLGDKPLWQIVLTIICIAIFVLLPSILFSMSIAIFTFYNFKLSKARDRYIRRSGLITKREVTMKISRLQMVIKKQGWLGFILKRSNLIFKQNQNSGEEIEAETNNKKIVVPSINELEFQQLINEVYPSNQVNSIKYNAISKRFVIRHTFYILLPLYLLLVVLSALTVNNSLIFTITTIFMVLSLLVFLRWKRWGYALDDNYLYIRNGYIGVNYQCIPIFKIQQTKLKQSLFLRRHRLCVVKLVLASGSVVIPYISHEKGREIIDISLAKLEKSHLSWM